MPLSRRVSCFPLSLSFHEAPINQGSPPFAVSNTTSCAMAYLRQAEGSAAALHTEVLAVWTLHWLQPELLLADDTPPLVRLFDSASARAQLRGEAVVLRTSRSRLSRVAGAPRGELPPAAPLCIAGTHVMAASRCCGSWRRAASLVVAANLAQLLAYPPDCFTPTRLTARSVALARHGSHAIADGMLGAITAAHRLHHFPIPTDGRRQAGGNNDPPEGREASDDSVMGGRESAPGCRVWLVNNGPLFWWMFRDLLSTDQRRDVVAALRDIIEHLDFVLDVPLCGPALDHPELLGPSSCVTVGSAAGGGEGDALLRVGPTASADLLDEASWVNVTSSSRGCVRWRRPMTTAPHVPGNVDAGDASSWLRLRSRVKISSGVLLVCDEQVGRRRSLDGGSALPPRRGGTSSAKTEGRREPHAAPPPCSVHYVLPDVSSAAALFGLPVGGDIPPPVRTAGCGGIECLPLSRDFLVWPYAVSTTSTGQVLSRQHPEGVHLVLAGSVWPLAKLGNIQHRRGSGGELLDNDRIGVDGGGGGRAAAVGGGDPSSPTAGFFADNDRIVSVDFAIGLASTLLQIGDGFFSHASALRHIGIVVHPAAQPRAAAAFAQVRRIGDDFLRGTGIPAFPFDHAEKDPPDDEEVDRATSWSCVTEMGGEFLSQCRRLTEVDLGVFQNLRYICGSCLQSCHALTSISLSGMAHLTSIGSDFLFNSAALESLDTRGWGGPGFVHIGSKFMARCEKLTRVDLSGLRHVNIIEDGFLIGSGSFSRGLTIVNVAAMHSLTRIGENFLFASAVVDFMTREDGVASLAPPLPAASSALLTAVGKGFLEICDCLVGVDLRGWTSLCSIPQHCCLGCQNLAWVQLPPSVTSIGLKAFASCPRLISFHIVHPLRTLPAATKEEEEEEEHQSSFTPLVGIAEIMGGFMRGNAIATNRPAPSGPSSLAQLSVTGRRHPFTTAAGTSGTVCHFPGLRHLGPDAWCGCHTLTRVDLGDLTHLTSLPDQLFADCPVLTRATFSRLPRVSAIGNQVLSRCPLLVDVVFADIANVTTIGHRFLADCTSLCTLDLTAFAPVTTVPRSADLPSGEGDDEVRHEGVGLTAVGDGFLSGCSALEHVDVASLRGVVSLGNSFLSQCRTITSLDTSTFQRLARVGCNFLSHCSSLVTLNTAGLPRVAMSSGYFLQGCVALRSVDIRDLATRGRQRSVGGHDGDENAAAAGEVSSIGFYFLQNCQSLSGVFDARPLADVSSIGSGFLDSCSRLQEIYFSAFDVVVRSTTPAVDPSVPSPTTTPPLALGCFSLTAGGAEAPPPLPRGCFSLTLIKSSFLHRCSSLTRADFSGLNNVTHIDHYFLNGCTALRTVSLRGFGAVETIGDGFLNGCTSLTCVDIRPLRRLRLIGHQFLKDCASLQRSGGSFGLRDDDDDGAAGAAMPYDSEDLREELMGPAAANNTAADGVPQLSGSFSSPPGIVRSLLRPPVAFRFGGLSNVTEVGNGFLAGCSSLADVSFNGLSNLKRIGRHALDHRGSAGPLHLDLAALCSLTEVGAGLLGSRARESGAVVVGDDDAVWDHTNDHRCGADSGGTDNHLVRVRLPAAAVGRQQILASLGFTGSPAESGS